MNFSVIVYMPKGGLSRTKYDTAKQRSYMSNLSGAELYKYNFRSEVFLKKYVGKEPFVLVNGKKIVFVKQPEVVKLIKNKQSLNGLKLIGEDGKTYGLKDILKNEEFGGKGEGGGTVKEDAALSVLKKQLNEAKKKEKSATIKVKVGNTIYKIAGVASTKGTPKSDFHLLDINGKEVVWISHKDGKTPKDFQQWGGVSAQKEAEINRHKETQKFIADLKKTFPKGLPPATTLYRKIKDKKMRMLAVYGNQYGKALGQQNVSVLLQSRPENIKLIKKGSYYELGASHVHYNGEDIREGFEPVLMAIYKGDRDNEGLKGTRLGISPIESRKGNPF